FAFTSRSVGEYLRNIGHGEGLLHNHAGGYLVLSLSKRIQLRTDVTGCNSVIEKSTECPKVHADSGDGPATLAHPFLIIFQELDGYCGERQGLVLCPGFH